MSNTKPYVEAKFKNLKTYMRHLVAIQSLSCMDCQDIYGKSKKDLKKNIYEKIAKEALK